MKITRLDLGEGKTERKTAGWTDKQIFGKSVEEIDRMIKGGEMVLDTLRQNVTEQEKRIHDLRRILRRKQELAEEGYRPE